MMVVAYYVGGDCSPNKGQPSPFLENTVTVIKDVPAEVCASCHESHMTGEVTDRVTALLKQLRSLQTEVSVISYSALPRAA
jgi:cytochrome c553